VPCLSDAAKMTGDFNRKEPSLILFLHVGDIDPCGVECPTVVSDLCNTCYLIVRICPHASFTTPRAKMAASKTLRYQNIGKDCCACYNARAGFSHPLVTWKTIGHTFESPPGISIEVHVRSVLPICHGFDETLL
jgi:hypothetical protein